MAAEGQPDWIHFTDETATRLVADPSVGVDDPFEKDIAVGDVDKDGDPDVIVVRKARFSTPGGQPNVLFLNEGGTMVDRTADFIPQFNDATDDRDVVLVDVNDDRWLDIITATTFSEQPRIYMNLGNDEQGQWLGFQYNPDDNRLPTFSPAPKFCSVAAGDITGDRIPDLFFVDYDNTLEDRLLINDGNGFFTDETAIRMTAETSNSSFGTAGEIVDINRDGFNDIIKCSTLDDNPNSVRILYNDGTGNFPTVQHLSPTVPYMMLTGDFNNDFRPDVFVVTDAQDVMLINRGNDAEGHAIFEAIFVTDSPNTAGFGGNIRIVDMDDDGFNDVLVADVDTDTPGCDRRMTILKHSGSAFILRLTDPLNGETRPWNTSGTFDVAVLDINGDGLPDIWSGTCEGNRIFINTPDGGEDQIPTVSAWGAVTMTLLVLAAGSVVFRRAFSVPGTIIPRRT